MAGYSSDVAPAFAGSQAWIDNFVVEQGDVVPTCGADLALPYGELDFGDVLAFLVAFAAMEPEADLSAPIGEFDFADVLIFLFQFDICS